MKCREAEKRLYLYSELTTREREETDKHLRNCMSCRRAFERASILRQAISAMNANVPPMSNESHMTRQIMNAIETTQKLKPSRPGTFLDKLFPPALRYSMAAASLFLMIFFVSEYTATDELMFPYKQYPRRHVKRTTLNLASFHSAFLTAKENNERKAKPISQWLTSCLQTPAADCKECANKFSKP